VTVRIREKVARLQKVGSKAEETSQAGARHGNGIAGTGDGAWGWGAGGVSGDADGANGGGGRDDRCGGVVEHWGGGWGSRAGAADHGAGDIDWLADGARAVGDGQGGGLGDSVGLAVVAELSGHWAHGGQSRNHLGGVGNIASRIGGGDSGGEGQDGGDLELHVD